MRFDWAGLLRAGLALGLRPEDVWALTPAELRLLLGEGIAPMGRDGLNRMLAAFPDVEGCVGPRGGADAPPHGGGSALPGVPPGGAIE